MKNEAAYEKGKKNRHEQTLGRGYTMRKTSNVIVGLMSAAVCAFVSYMMLGSGLFTIIYNLGFLAIMLLILILAEVFGFRRMRQTVKGLDSASRKLMAAYKNKPDLLELTRAGAQIFEVEYLDRKYQEYLGYLRKTNSPCDIGDYIGEYEINNYTHRRLVEMVPDILTSFGILGTFIGLVIGLAGFNPVSYEAMATSITSLVEGIKIAFVTSIYGISLSMAYNYWLRGALTGVSESLDNFLDKYYLCAVSPTDATAMNHVLANQKEQIRALETMGRDMSEQMSGALDPVLAQISQTLEDFVGVVTLNQQEMLERVASQVASSMKKEYMTEFFEMHNILKETNRAQKEYLNILGDAQHTFEESIRRSAGEIAAAASGVAASQKETARQLEQQQEHLSQFVAYMSEVMQRMSTGMSAMNEQTGKALEAMTGQAESLKVLAEQSAANAARAQRALEDARAAAEEVEHPTVHTQIEDMEELTQRLDRVADLMERQARKAPAKKGFFR
ncbi:MAG: hypothetical protein Q4B59_01175 [Lachnospiraceae bacterium]|nr:hypothetical protein [Lachnospiraceae bacterium]